MKNAALALAIFAGIGTGAATAQTAAVMATGTLPDCFDSNYDAQRGLFTIRNDVKETVVNQQCVLHVGSRSDAAPESRFTAGNYVVYLSNGGGGGAGGTLQSPNGGGGAGGGGAGALETQTRVYLMEGAYKLTIGAGGPGGRACVGAPFNIAGGPGLLGSPSNFVRASTGEVLAGRTGADSYVRPSRSQLDKMAGPRDGHGGSGLGQTSGGHGGKDREKPGDPIVLAEAGQVTLPAYGGRVTDAIVLAEVTQNRNPSRDPTTTGGGGGASSRAGGGNGGGEAPGQFDRPPQTGSLGSGGGGGEGGRFECDQGARGGHGYIAFRRF